MFRMMLAAVAVAMAMGCSPAPSAPDPLSAPARRAVTSVISAIEAEQARQAALPEAADDRERLQRLGRLDQVGRARLQATDLSALTPEERAQAHAAIFAAIGEVDARNIAALLEMAPAEGWFTPDLYGEAGSQAAFLIVQHAGPEHWRRFLPLLEPLARSGRIDAGQYALMHDRLQVSTGAPQRYGSQLTCRDGRWILLTVDDPNGLDARRAAVGLEPIADYLARFESTGGCG